MAQNPSGGVPEQAADRRAEACRDVPPSLNAGVYDVLGVEWTAAAILSHGSTGPEQVKEQVRRWKEELTQNKLSPLA